MKCQLCGLEYQEQHGRPSCTGCALSSGCGFVKCPNCGYENPREPSLYRLLARRKDTMKTSAVAAEPGEATISSVAALRKGTRSQIVRIDQTDKTRLHKLLVMGLLPGALVELIQKFPSYVIKVGHTQIAIDAEMARGIFVQTGNARPAAAPSVMQRCVQFLDDFRRRPAFTFTWKEGKNETHREPKRPENRQTCPPDVLEHS